ncbi:MAG: type II secretion system secretin GspD [Gammaproteobacteria bacterium]|nr:type II secretion system secretin GspD [Gammaproteobacteria bacterium]MBQ0838740.1 type II secretion system secretin GspD [Gammaproteobacteria bacterium]
MAWFNDGKNKDVKKLMCAGITSAQGQIKYGLTVTFCTLFLLGACAEQPLMERVDEALLKEQAAQVPDAVVEEVVLPASEQAVSSASQTVTGGSQNGATAESTASEIYLGNGRFIASGTAGNNYRDNGEGDVTLNFEASPIREVVKTILGDILKLNYAIDEGVNGNVSMRTTRPISHDALLSTLESLLQVNGAVLIKNGDFYEILAVSDGSVPTGLSASTRLDPAKGYQVLIVPLQYIGAGQMNKIIETVKTTKTKIVVDDYRNILLLAGPHGELANIRQTIGIFDVDQLQGKSVGFFRLENVDAVTILSELETIFGNQSEGPLAGLVDFIEVERLNAILVVSAQKQYLKKAETWIRRLDQAENLNGANMYVYHVQNGKAENLADILSQLFDSKRKSDLGRAVRQAGRASVSNAKNSVKKPGVKTQKNQGAGTLDVGEVTIIADTENNALVISSTPGDYKGIEKALKKLDVLPLQVLVEASIVEVTLDKELKYGLQWFFKNSHGRFNGVGGLNIPPSGIVGSTLPGVLNPADFTYALFDAAGTRAVLNAVAGDSRLNVLSSPSLMVLDNHTATIRVGDQVPIRTSETTNTASDDLNTTSQIQYRDTGVTLEVTPRVNAGGMVIMDITQRVDDVDQTDTSGIDSPTIIQREITTSVAVQSNETIVLGGLIRENKQSANRGIPFLKDIPYVGFIFGGTEKIESKTELVVMIKPIAITNSNEARSVTEEYRKKMQGVDFSYLN